MLLAAAAAAHAADIQSLQVSRDGERYRIDMSVRVHAPASAAYAAFVAPGGLPRVNPDVRAMDFLGKGEGDTVRMYAELRVCIALYCRTLHQLQDLRLEPRQDGGDVHADMVFPGDSGNSSDFSYGRADWTFRAAGEETQLHFNAELQPAFWLPPAIGPWLMERSMRLEAERTAAGIERLANPPQTAAR
ncbi:MAG: SRPBCC family protein [Nevskia sp.]|nr:SRPBCC family protein [Nevskia sp.]